MAFLFWYDCFCIKFMFLNNIQVIYLQISTMKKTFASLFILSTILFFTGCNQEPTDKRIKQMDPVKTVEIAKSIEAIVKPELADDLTLRLWGIDSLVISPIAIDI